MSLPWVPCMQMCRTIVFLKWLPAKRIYLPMSSRGDWNIPVRVNLKLKEAFEILNIFVSFQTGLRCKKHFALIICVFFFCASSPDQYFWSGTLLFFFKCKMCIWFLILFLKTHKLLLLFLSVLYSTLDGYLGRILKHRFVIQPSSCVIN